MRQAYVFAIFAAVICVEACHPQSSDSEVQGITGRTSMGKRDPFQCYNLSYSGDEQVNGKWIAGADGTTFGSMQNGVITSQCGKVFTIRSKKTGKSAEFILVDRIWENDGVNGRRYNNEHNAKIKSGDIGPGYEQIDIAVAPFNSLFGGHNPQDGDYEIIGLGSGSGSLSGGQSQGNPSGWNKWKWRQDCQRLPNLHEWQQQWRWLGVG